MDGKTEVAGGVSFEWKGADKVSKRLELIAARLSPRLAARLYRWCEGVMTDAKENYVPVKDGILRGSGFVEQPVISPTNISCRMGFGGGSVAYAAKQHENLDYQHTVGGPKYLERPIYAHLPELKAEIAAEAASTVGDGS